MGSSITSFEPGLVGHYSPDFAGSFDEWVLRSARSLAERFRDGDPAVRDLVGRFQGIGSPNMADFASGAMNETEWLDSLADLYQSNVDAGLYGLPGLAGGDPANLRTAIHQAWASGQGTLYDWIAKQPRPQESTSELSYQTYDFFARMISNNPSDPWIVGEFGTAPTARATFTENPNSPAATTAANNATDLAIAELKAETDLAVATKQAETALGVAGINAKAAIQQAEIRLQGIREQIQSNETIAFQVDATKRYIAEGNWGTQKWVTEQNNQGAMDRLLLELGSRDKDRAQRALEARQLHHREMLGLVLEVAKYDSELAAAPRNWLAYASWLDNRGVVVNGLSLAMAADIVPEGDATAAAAESAQPAGAVAASTGIQQASTAQQEPQPAGQEAATTPPGQQGAGAAPEAQTSPYTVGGVDLTSTDYAGLANSLMGVDQNAPAGAPTADELAKAQSLYDTSKRVPGFSAWKGPTTNALGMTVEPQGHKVDYRQFSNLLPTQQEMKVGEVQSVRGKFGTRDWAKELERSRPKGQATGVAGRG